MRALLGLVVVLPFCPGCFTLLGAGIAAAGGGANAVSTGAQLDAEIAGEVIEGMVSAASRPSSQPEDDLPRYAAGDAYLCTIGEDRQVIEARSPESAIEVCAASNDLETSGACVCHAIRETTPEDG